MQKVFLYLYPLKEYMEAEISYERAIDENRAYMIDTLNNLVELRYRQQGYNIYWVVFGLPENIIKPEIERVHPGINIIKEDVVISNGIIFNSSENEPIYPELSCVFAKLPSVSETEDLKIGGFHFWDCVNRFGKYAYERAGFAGKVLVDEDLTNFMFSKLYWQHNFLDRKGIKNEIPVFREHTFKGLGYSEVEDWEDGIVWQIMRAERADKPWYVNQ